MRFVFIERHCRVYPVRVMCTVLDVSPSGYYRWRQRPESARQREDRRLRVEIRAIFRANRQAYGRPRVHEALRVLGFRCGPMRVRRLMRQEGLRAKKGRRFRQTTRAVSSRPTTPNVLNREFNVAAPNTAWVGDITYLWTYEGWLYLAVILDLYSRRVIGWATGERLTEGLAHAALQRALSERRIGQGLIHHSDRGSQYTSVGYQRLLEAHGMVVSMSRKGNCWDNAVVESFFATLKVELGDRFPSRALAHDALFEYIEIFYNRARMHGSIGFISPAEAEARFENEAAA